MWAVESGEDGVPRVRRSKLEPDDFEGMEGRQASRTLARKIAGETCAAFWGLFGADLVDDPTLISEIPVGVARSFNAAARDEATPRVYEWEELRRAFTSDAVDHARKAVSQGMRVRMASRYLDLPFMITADVLEQMSDVPREELKAAVDYFKVSGSKVAQQGDVVRRVAAILRDYVEPGSHRIAVDEKAKAFWEAYYGPYGEEMVREIKKRVRADLSAAWMRKNGVDDAAAAYWSDYFGEYGAEWVSIVPKKISPSK